MIYSVSAGAGHVRAAEAVLMAFKRFYPGVEAEHTDVMKLVPSSFKNAYAESYLKIVNSLPSVWGWMYKKSDLIPQASALTHLRKFIQQMNTSKIIEHAQAFQPDVILATHFLPAEIFSDLAKKRRSTHRTAENPVPKLAVAITDHDVHQIWLHPGVDRYYAASEEIAYRLAERNISSDSIKVTGIPCDPVFGELIDQPARQRLRKMMELGDAPAPFLLINAHGCGVGGPAAARSLCDVLSSVLKKGPPQTFLVVCGRNPKIKDTLMASMKIPAGNVVKLFGFVTNMHELMGIADLVVTKPGGLTTSECLARGLPMVLVSPIPGQEERNAEMLLENGCAVLARTPAALSYKLGKLLNDRGLLNQMRENCRRISRPYAAADIAADIVAMGRSGS